MSGLSAQVSVYPLRQERLSPAIEDVLHIFREHGLDVRPGPMSTLILGEERAIFTAIQNAFVYVAGRGEIVMAVTLSNACPAASADDYGFPCGSPSDGIVNKEG